MNWDGATWNQVSISDLYGNYPVARVDRLGLVGPTHLILASRGETTSFANDQVLETWDGGSRCDGHSLTLQSENQGGTVKGPRPRCGDMLAGDVRRPGLLERIGRVRPPPTLSPHDARYQGGSS